MALVLIVDDRATNLKILRRFAERLGKDVVVQTFERASAALDAVSQQTTDLIVTDFVMPEIDGEEFVRRCRQHPNGRDVPIIVVTAFEDREFRYRALDAGASDYLLSPVDAREFCVRARNLLTIREQRKAIQAHAESLEGQLADAIQRHADDVRRREEMLRRIVNTVPALIRACDGNGSLTLMNEYHRHYFPVGCAPVANVDAHTLFGPAYVERHRGLSRQIFDGGRPFTDVEETVLDVHGHERVLLTTKAPLTAEDGRIEQVVTVSLDITERIQGELALKESEQRFRSLIESSVLGIVIERDGKPLFANQTYAAIFGFDRVEDVLALDALDSLYAPAEVERIRQFRSSRLLGEAAPSRYEFQGVRRNGDVIWVEAQDQEVSWKGERVVQSTVADITLRKQYEERLERQANFDDVTGLPNRVLALDRLRGAVLSARRHHHKVGVLFLDLDHFKKINDTLGHAVGDQLLRSSAERLTRCVRAEDTVARLSGDEFTVILPKLASSAHVEPVIQKILDAFSLPFSLGSEEAFVSASIGVTVSPDDGEDPHVLMQNADAAMYRAKEQGRNSFHYFTPELNQRAIERMRIESHLLHALDRGELQVHYQPIVDIGSGAVIGAEALLRWFNPILGEVEPERFIPLAEDTGLIVPIGRWVLNSACRQIHLWSRAGAPPLRVSVNISSRQFRGSSLVDALSSALALHDVPADLLELEITEGLLMDELPQTRANLRDLASLSVRLSLDDFGTGYSSLKYLRQFPVDTLKIDKSFVAEVASDAGNATVVEAIIAMGHRLGLLVVGEGIETEEQLSFLRSRGCDLAQGYYFSRPLPAEEFRDWLDRRQLFLRHALHEAS